MANISLMGVDYPDVPSIVLPVTGGGTAEFYENDAFIITETPDSHGGIILEITGSHMINIVIPPYEYDYEKGYITNGKWTYQDSNNNHNDFYVVDAGHQYCLYLGNTVGTRFRATILPTNPVGTTSDIQGTRVVETNDPVAMASAVFQCSSNGYLAIQKDNVGTSGLKTYLVDITPTE